MKVFMMCYFSVRNSISGKILILGSSFKMIFPIIIARFFDQQCFEMKLMGHFQRHIQNLFKHLRWSVCRNSFATILDVHWVLNKRLIFFILDICRRTPKYGNFSQFLWAKVKVLRYVQTCNLSWSECLRCLMGWLVLDN